MTHFDQHKAEEIMLLLAPLGLSDWSKKITDTISSAHTPVELATNLHHVLKNLKVTHPLPQELERRIDILIKDLEKVIEHHHQHHQ